MTTLCAGVPAGVGAAVGPGVGDGRGRGLRRRRRSTTTDSGRIAANPDVAKAAPLPTAVRRKLLRETRLSVGETGSMFGFVITGGKQPPVHPALPTTQEL